MSLENHKITVYQDNVKDLPDYPSDGGYTAQRLKEIFDGRTDKEIKEKFNALIDDLVARFREVDVKIEEGSNLNIKNGEGETSLKQTAWEEEAANTATGKGAVSFGGYNEAHAKCSMAVNYNNEVRAEKAFAANSGNVIPEEAEGAFVSGHQNRAKSTYQTIGGAYSKVDEGDSFIIGNGSSESDRRNAFKVTKNGDVIAGAYSDASEDDAFVIGNGTSKTDLKNAFVVKKTGDVNVSGNVEAIKANVDGVNARNISATNNITANNKITSKDLEVKGNFVMTKASIGPLEMSEKNSAYGENTVGGKGSAALGGGNDNKGVLSMIVGRSNAIPENLESVFVAGYKNTAATSRQFVFGVYASPTTSDMLVVGNGSSDSTRKNAFVVKRNGDAEVQGKIVAANIEAINGIDANSITAGHTITESITIAGVQITVDNEGMLRIPAKLFANDITVLNTVDAETVRANVVNVVSALKIGNTTINEEQLKKLLALIS